MLHKRCSYVVGVDISETAVEGARVKAPHVRRVAASGSITAVHACCASCWMLLEGRVASNSLATAVAAARRFEVADGFDVAGLRTLAPAAYTRIFVDISGKVRLASGCSRGVRKLRCTRPLPAAPPRPASRSRRPAVACCATCAGQPGAHHPPAPALPRRVPSEVGRQKCVAPACAAICGRKRDGNPGVFQGVAWLPRFPAAPLW